MCQILYFINGSMETVVKRQAATPPLPFPKDPALGHLQTPSPQSALTLISCGQSGGVYKTPARADFSAELLWTQPRRFVLPVPSAPAFLTVPLGEYSCNALWISRYSWTSSDSSALQHSCVFGSTVQSKRIILCGILLPFSPVTVSNCILILHRGANLCFPFLWFSVTRRTLKPAGYFCLPISSLWFGCLGRPQEIFSWANLRSRCCLFPRKIPLVYNRNNQNHNNHFIKNVFKQNQGFIIIATLHLVL